MRNRLRCIAKCAAVPTATRAALHVRGRRLTHFSGHAPRGPEQPPHVLRPILQHQASRHASSSYCLSTTSSVTAAELTRSTAVGKRSCMLCYGRTATWGFHRSRDAVGSRALLGPMPVLHTHTYIPGKCFKVSWGRRGGMSEYKIRSQKRSRQSYAPYHTKKVSQSPRELVRLPEGAPGAEGARTCWALNRVAPIHAVGGVNVFMASAGLSLVHCVSSCQTH